MTLSDRIISSLSESLTVLDNSISKIMAGKSEDDLRKHSFWQLFTLNGPMNKGKSERAKPIKLLVLATNMGQESSKFIKSPLKVVKSPGSVLVDELGLEPVDRDQVTSMFNPRNLDNSRKVSDFNAAARSADMMIHVDQNNNVLAKSK